MSFASIAHFCSRATPTRVAYPIQCLHDIPTGEFVQAERGNYIMMGGFADVNSTIGPGNSFKTDDEIYPGLTILGRFISSAMVSMIPRTPCITTASTTVPACLKDWKTLTLLLSSIKKVLASRLAS